MICPQCSIEFEPRRWSAKYCSVKCGKDFWKPTKEYQKQYRNKNVEKRRSYDAEYYKKNRVELLESRKDYKSQWCREHPENRIATEHKRRAKKTAAGGFFTPEEWFTLCFAVGFKCLCCKESKPLVADHVVPIALGGTSWLYNIQPLCQPCNSKKGTKIIDYREDPWQ